MKFNLVYFILSTTLIVLNVYFLNNNNKNQSCNLNDNQYKWKIKHDRSDIGILFDVSGSMSSPFNSMNNNNYGKRLDELSNILERIVRRKNKQKNEKIRIFSILFGGYRELIYDFGNILNISNNVFEPLYSENEKPSNYSHGFCKAIKDILSDYGKKALYIDKYLYSKSGPTERLCEMGYNIMKKDRHLCNVIYDELPNHCKGFIKGSSMGVAKFLGEINILGFQPLKCVEERFDEGTNDIIKNIYIKCINRYISIIMNEEIFSRRYNNNKFKFFEGNDLLNIIKNLENKIITPDNSKIKILDLFEDYIYGNTPLYTALNLSFFNFQTQSHKDNNKYIFIISDGELNDVDKNFDYITEIREKAENNEIMIISIFLTSSNIPYKSKLYDTIQSHFTKGAQDLFLMSSTLDYQHPIIKFFIQKGWDIPRSGGCKLFVEINNSKNLNEFIDLFNEAISMFNLKYNYNSKENPNSLMNLLSLTSINDYVNSNVINKFNAKEQIGGTCYANAISAGICLSSAKVIGRPKLDFFDIRQKIIDKYDKGEGGDTFGILNEYLVNYRLHHKIVKEDEARKAIMETRPCVAKFRLTERQWENFENFYEQNPKGILTKEIINKPNNYSDEDGGGHAVVLTHISKDYLKFLNSWGCNWGDNGYFKIKDAEVLGVEFADIYWETSDLTSDEITYYNNYMNNLTKKINDSLFD